MREGSNTMYLAAYLDDLQKGTIYVPINMSISTNFVPFDMPISTNFVPFDMSISTKFVPFDMSISTNFVPFDMSIGTNFVLFDMSKGGKFTAITSIADNIGHNMFSLKSTNTLFTIISSLRFSTF